MRYQIETRGAEGRRVLVRVTDEGLSSVVADLPDWIMEAEHCDLISHDYNSGPLLALVDSQQKAIMFGEVYNTAAALTLAVEALQAPGNDALRAETLSACVAVLTRQGWTLEPVPVAPEGKELSEIVNVMMKPA